MRIILEYLFLELSEEANVCLGVHIAVTSGSKQKPEDKASTATCEDRQHCVPLKVSFTLFLTGLYVYIYIFFFFLFF